MSALYPRYRCSAKSVSEGSFEFERLPLAHRIEVLDEIGEQAEAELLDGAARLVAHLVLVEAPVRIARCLPDVEPPARREDHVVQENDIDRVFRSPDTSGCRIEPASGPSSGRHPDWLSHRTALGAGTACAAVLGPDVP